MTGAPSPSGVDAVHSLTEVAQHHALRVGGVSVADRLCCGLVGDPAVTGDLDVLVGAVEPRRPSCCEPAADTGPGH